MTVYDLIPMEDRVIILQDAAEEKTKGGILLADVSQEAPAKGVVIAVGPGKIDHIRGEFIPVECNVGDGVYFSKFGGSRIQFPDGTGCLILRQCDILAKFDRSLDKEEETTANLADLDVPTSYSSRGAFGEDAVEKFVAGAELVNA
jgi:chaperonin GroES